MLSSALGKDKPVMEEALQFQESAMQRVFIVKNNAPQHHVSVCF